ncbi:hypothetical protein [Hippea maritima]|uniref:Uncharacterized protein n=1 Tax=Hippea maritima (strain ATCC 700847 / DSM 10411 / MH2) TaxID=760142 RepID=F2LV73_HIPMA|nr:hypothetical protein [Hippea maritima]AEA33657.1 hypothetical protein Hipma_0687 [Hippea maritima DSM 10411]
MKIIEYIDEMPYYKEIADWCYGCYSYSNSHSPEEILIQEEEAGLREKIEEIREELQKKMRDIILSKYSDILSDKEWEYLRKLFDADKCYTPEEQNQHTAASRIGVTREYFGLIIHRVYKKLVNDKKLKQSCLKELRRWESILYKRYGIKENADAR